MGGPSVVCDRKSVQQARQVGGCTLKKGLVNESEPVDLTAGVK